MEQSTRSGYTGTIGRNFREETWRDHPIKYDYTQSPYNPTGQRQYSHTTHQKHRVTEINSELAAQAEMPNQPEEDPVT